MRAGIVLAACAVLALPAQAKPAAAKELAGDDVLQLMLDEDPLGFGGAEAHVTMLLVDSAGNQRQRSLDMLSRKDGKTRRSFVRFTAPTDLAGTAFLSIDDAGDRVQHLYLPALQRTRRISSTQSTGRFVGTDYSYADLDYRDLADAAKKRLPDEKVGGNDTWVVEALPRDAASEYARVVVWVSKANHLPLRIRYFDSAGKEIKRLTAQEVRKVGGRWILGETKLVDLKRDHTTVIKVVDVTLRKDVPLDQFTVRALERG